MDGAQNPSLCLDGREECGAPGIALLRGQQLLRASVTRGLGLRWLCFHCCIPGQDPELAVEWECWYL